MKRFASRVSAAIGIAALAACSSGGDAPPTPSVTTASDVVRMLAESACERRASCCDASARDFDRERCVAEASADIEHGFQFGPDAPPREVDAGAVQRCADRLSEPPPGCSFAASVGVDLPDECRLALDGTRAPGETCLDDVECRGFSTADTRCIEDTCAVLADVGQPCRFDEQCRGSDVQVIDCLEPRDDGFCAVRFARPAVACAEREDPLRDGGVCVVTTRGAPGDPCFRLCENDRGLSQCEDVHHDDASTERAVCYANDGLQCGQSGVCEPLAPLGGACAGFGSAVGCEAGSWCDGGVCVPLVGEGEACRLGCNCCDEGLYCDGSRCTARAGEGEACRTTRGCAAGLFCEDGACRALPGPGGACVGYDDCAPGLLCDQEAGRCIAAEDLACVMGAS